MDTFSLQLAQRGIITIPKSLRRSYNLETGDEITLLDLGGVFVLNPKRSEIDAIADKLAEKWTEEGETLETMLAELRRERDTRGNNESIS